MKNLWILIVRHWFRNVLFSQIKISYPKLHDSGGFSYIRILQPQQLYLLQNQKCVSWRLFEMLCRKIDPPKNNFMLTIISIIGRYLIIQFPKKNIIKQSLFKRTYPNRPQLKLTAQDRQEWRIIVNEAKTLQEL